MVRNRQFICHVEHSTVNAIAGMITGLAFTVNSVKYEAEYTNNTGAALSYNTVLAELANAVNNAVFATDIFVAKAYVVGGSYPGLMIVVDYDAERLQSFAFGKSTANTDTYLTVYTAVGFHTPAVAQAYSDLQLAHEAYVAANPSGDSTAALMTAVAEVVASSTQLAIAAGEIQSGVAALVTNLQQPLTIQATGSGSAQSDPTVGVTLASLAGFMMGKGSAPGSQKAAGLVDDERITP